VLADHGGGDVAALDQVVDVLAGAAENGRSLSRCEQITRSGGAFFVPRGK